MSRGYVEEQLILQVRKLSNTTKKHSKSMKTKTKNYIRNYIRYTAKKSFLMVYVGMYDCDENIKIKLLIYN